jgi:hypothetical protein
MRKVYLALFCLVPAIALADMREPTVIAGSIHTSAPYGQGTYRWLGISAYDAALWTDAATWSWDAPFALALQYHMHFTGKDITERSLSEMQEIEPLSDADKTAYREQFSVLFPDVQSGDVITALYKPGKGAVVYHNGKMTGSIKDDVLARRFLGIWLDKRTSAPSLRKKLLHLN